MCKKEWVNIQNGKVLNENDLIELKDNAMLKYKPDLWETWDFEKNDELGFDIWSISKGNNNKPFWIGKCGHKWDSSAKSRSVSKSGCPYCAKSNPKVLKGFNDMWTTNPDLARLLADKEDGYKYTQWSGKRVDWKCFQCNNIIKDKTIRDINGYGLSCEICSDGFSYPEKVLREMLKFLNLEYKYDIKFEWSDNKRYDFVFELDEKIFIIEAHGKQHYNGGFKSVGGKSLKEERQNDKYKRKLALKNNIDYYIELDCRKSDFEYIKQSIIDSEIPKLLNLNHINWNEINKNAQCSVSVKCLELWNKGIKSMDEISKLLKIHKEMVRRYLINWSNIDKCDFLKNKGNKNYIYQLDLNDNLIKEWESVNDILKHHFKDLTFRTPLVRVLEGLEDELSGFKWKYKKKRVKCKATEIVKLDINYNVVETYESMQQACVINNIPSSSTISDCCRGKRKSSHGYKWMYKEDYEKLG